MNRYTLNATILKTIGCSKFVSPISSSISCWNSLPSDLNICIYAAKFIATNPVHHMCLKLFLDLRYRQC